MIEYSQGILHIYTTKLGHTQIHLNTLRGRLVRELEMPEFEILGNLIF